MEYRRAAMPHQRARVERVEPSPLSVPLVDPFVIASARVDVTRAVLVTVTLRDEATGARAVGLGEAAALPPVTREDQPDLLRQLDGAAGVVHGRRLDVGDDLSAVDALLDAALPGAPVARAGLEVALLDALARLRGIPARVLLGGEPARRARTLVTDVTIPIHDPPYMARLARGWHARGFDCFKIKVGIDRDQDLRAIRAIRDAVPAPRFRLDANGGYTSEEALSLLRELATEDVVIECFEQPCAAGDVDGMARVAAASGVPIVADESVKTRADLERLVEAGAADGVNLKLAKSGGMIAAFELGRAARTAGLSIMCGGMVETRVGMTAAAQVAAALGGVEFVDLDTVYLLREDPFRGGYAADGPTYVLSDEPGLAVERA